MTGLIMIIFVLAFFTFLSVCMLISFVKDKDAMSFILLVVYFLTALFFVYGLFTELFWR